MTREEASGALTKVAYIGFAVSLLGALVLLVYAFTGTVQDRHVLGSSGEVERNAAYFCYVDLSRSGIELFARSQFTTVVMCVFFVNMVYQEWRTIAKMSDRVRREHDAAGPAPLRRVLADRQIRHSSRQPSTTLEWSAP